MQDKSAGEEATTSFITGSNNNWGQVTTPLMSSCATDGSSAAAAAGTNRNGSGPTDSTAGTIGSILCNSSGKGKGADEDPDEDSNSECDALTYRGIYLPTLTNRFRDKKLETAYQRYACRQVGG